MRTSYSIILFCILFGYFLGTVNPAYLIGKLRGFDIRKNGSGNAGASNAVITMGKKPGAICAVFDIFKAYFSVKVVEILFPYYAVAGMIAGTSCIIGHMFPIFMDFHGGKGLACLGGVVLSFSAKVFLIMLFFELILALLFDYICVVPITASIIFPIVYTCLTKNLIGGMVFLPAEVLILYKHVENVKRIHKGLEARFSYLWKKEEEEARLRQNYNTQE